MSRRVKKMTADTARSLQQKLTAAVASVQRVITQFARDTQGHGDRVRELAVSYSS